MEEVQKVYSSLVEAVINAQTRNFLAEDRLANFIKRQEFPEEYIVQIFNFFTDVPVPAVVKFLSRHGISVKELESYYREYVQDIYPNPELEQLFL
ncbi:hypothetical protein SAMN00808754_1411 [Thermanaeromonas toyohensis ToBE]|uniref:Uncharacterized protein n=1 Tax=Thermanaeromonas toyohensis ToBE TaxID=698762 RepID=A0A1W1VSE9_9FIRM|nr:hypothetical protein [Thermanaeromonas toyohensis]SMB96150.1 hypothetical protein SAMN00808754_1411 [Thermanaeromonas toyohensis ToBE]